MQNGKPASASRYCAHSGKQSKRGKRRAEHFIILATRLRGEADGDALGFAKVLPSVVYRLISLLVPLVTNPISCFQSCGS